MPRFKPSLSLLALALFSAPVAADEDIFKIGVEALNKKDYRFAVVCFNDVLVKDPKNFEAYYYRGLAQVGKGFWESAINNFTETIRLNPNHARAYVARGNAYVEMKDYENAVRDHHKALQLDGKFALANISRGKSYEEIKNYRAVEDFNVAVRLNPHNHIPYLERGNAYLDGEKFDKAIQDFSEAIRFRSPNPVPYLKRAESYAKKGEYQKAIDDFSEVIRLDPKNTQAYLRRGALLRQMMDPDGSMEDWFNIDHRHNIFDRWGSWPPQRFNGFPLDKIGDFPFYDEGPPPK